MRVGFEKEDFDVFMILPALWYSWSNKQYIVWLSWGRWSLMLQLWGKGYKKREITIGEET